MVNQKTTAVRVIPVIGKKVGDTAEFGGLLGYAPIMPVNTCLLYTSRIFACRLKCLCLWGIAGTKQSKGE